MKKDGKATKTAARRRINFLQQLRVVQVYPAAAAVDLIPETFEGLARYARRISEIDGSSVAVVSGDLEASELPKRSVSSLPR